MKFLRHIPICRTAIAALALLCLVSCEKDSSGFKEKIYSDRKVLLLYSAAHNDITEYLVDDMWDFINSANHTNDPKADAILVYSHSGYSSPNPAKPSYLMHPYRSQDGKLVIDTLVTYPSSTISVSGTTLNTVLTYVKDNFPADEYGLIFSSHATGYVPAGYYSNSSSYENSYTPSAAKDRVQGRRNISLDPIQVSGEYESNPLVRSIGRDYYSSGESYEMNLEQFSEAIPMRLHYVVFDACLMGGIETAYQLRDKVDLLIASPIEILAEGMDYTTITSYLMARPQNNFAGFCENYYNHYNSQSGSYKSATLSVTDCTRLEPLALICKELFSNHRDALDKIDHSEIQRYYTISVYGDYHWFFDFGDIVEHLGCTEDELAEFNAALDDCMDYKIATDQYLYGSGGTTITHFSGLSMMLPNYAGDYLKNYYKTSLDWNFATSLVE